MIFRTCCNARVACSCTAPVLLSLPDIVASSAECEVDLWGLVGKRRVGGMSGIWPAICIRSFTFSSAFIVPSQPGPDPEVLDP